MKNISDRRNLYILFIFFISGFSALIYQIIWSKWLGLVFGNTTISASIVLSGFMLGLAIGSEVAKRLLLNLYNPIYLYAIAEFLIGLYAIFFSNLQEILNSFYILNIDQNTPFLIGLSWRFFLGFLILIFPTTLMGTTLPLLTEYFHKHCQYSNSWKVGLLYSVNTIGAAIGILMAGFVLIEIMGVQLTTIFAAILNFLVAILAIVFYLNNKDTVIGKFKENKNINSKNKISSIQKIAITSLFFSGGLALSSEILWMRLLETLIGNSTYAFSTVVFIFLTGIGLGSWVFSLRVKRFNNLNYLLPLILLLMGVWTLIALGLFEVLRSIISEDNGKLLPISEVLWNYTKTSFIIFPISFLSGAMFPIATRLLDQKSYEAEGKLIAKAYFWNTIGAVLGALIAGFLISAHLDFFQSLFMIATLYAMSALFVSLYVSRKSLMSFRVMLLTISCSLVLFYSSYNISKGSFFLRLMKDSGRDYKVLFHKTGSQGIATAVSRFGEYGDLLLVNGHGMTAKTRDTKMMAHLPLSIHSDPKHTLIICFGMGTTYRSAISYGESVTVVELVKEVFEAFTYFHNDAESAVKYKKGRLVVNDGRNYLATTTEKFDVITVDPPPPINGSGVNNLYSKEFYELARDRLSQGGIMAHWVPSPQIYSSGVEDEKTFLGLIKTFSEVFPYTYAIQGVDGVGIHLLGSLLPIQLDHEMILSKLSSKNINSDLNEWGAIPLDFYKKLTLINSEEIKGFTVTDDHPYLEFNLVRFFLEGRKKAYATLSW